MHRSGLWMGNTTVSHACFWPCCYSIFINNLHHRAFLHVLCMLLLFLARIFFFFTMVIFKADESRRLFQRWGNKWWERGGGGGRYVSSLPKAFSFATRLAAHAMTFCDFSFLQCSLLFPLCIKMWLLKLFM